MEIDASKSPIKSIGINGNSAMWEGDLEKLEKWLALFESLGFDHVEIPPHGLDVVVGGNINRKRLERIKSILQRFDLNYTVHAPDFLNLMDYKNINLHKAVFNASLEFTYEIRGRLLVYHAGRIPAEYERDETLLEELKAMERELLKEFSDSISNTDILIGIENADVDPSIVFGRKYAYSALIDKLVEQVSKIGKSNVGITLDFGHAKVASTHFGFDYLSSIMLASPYINSLHVYDSFGRPNDMDEGLPYMFQLIYGLDDLHLPLGWGDIPLEEAFSRLEISQAFMTIELNHRYKDEYTESLRIARYLASLVKER
ncbi:MAG: TIM barrel protein [bacterium]